jgi:D-glycero-alpha-D-manno-heptose-7-phosphate kinase
MTSFIRTPSVIRSRASLRLGLAGGGTDVAPYCDLHGGYILNVTIDRYAYAVLRLREDGMTRFEASDQQIDCLSHAVPVFELDGRLNLHKAVYNHFISVYNQNLPIALDLSTFCDAPVGSGLGSSSTLVVAMIKAFVELMNLALDDYAIALLAYRIERIDCGLQGGRQDQYSATFGGFNFMEFYKDDRAIVNTLRVKNWIVCELEASLILCFTGVSRESAHIISDQSKNVADGMVSTIAAMHGLKQEALVMKESLLKGDFAGFVESMRMGWDNKKKTSATVSTARIDEIYNAACDAGAHAGKVSGAGGGGFMWFFVPTEKRMNVIRTLTALGGQTSNCHFTHHGTQAWRI